MYSNLQFHMAISVGSSCLHQNYLVASL